MRQYAWAILVLAGVFEIGFSIGLKYSEGFTRLWPSVATATMIVLSLGLVGLLGPDRYRNCRVEVSRQVVRQSDRIYGLSPRASRMRMS